MNIFFLYFFFKKKLIESWINIKFVHFNGSASWRIVRWRYLGIGISFNLTAILQLLPGENEESAKKRGFDTHGYNARLADTLPLNRYISDMRHPMLVLCLFKMCIPSTGSESNRFFLNLDFNRDWIMNYRDLIYFSALLNIIKS